MIKGTAQDYEGLLRQKGMRPDALRLQVLEILVAADEFVDGKMLAQKLNEAGINSAEEKNRYVIRRLNAAGMLERKKLSRQNKYLFRLRPFDEIEKKFIPY